MTAAEIRVCSLCVQNGKTGAQEGRQASLHTLISVSQPTIITALCKEQLVMATLYVHL